MAQRCGHLIADEERLLTSPERPIVLLRGRNDSPLASEIAPDLGLVGLFLPYSPLHHLLLAAVDRPLVMTSGNLTQEPIAYRDDDEEAVSMVCLKRSRSSAIFFLGS